MKKLKFLPLLLIALVVIACNNDDDNTPDIVNEEELITSVVVTLVNGPDTVVLSSRDLDGDGPNDPEVTVSGNLQNNVSYDGSVQFLNETESPVDNITLEVIEEADEHQVFFIPGSGLIVTPEYVDTDADGNPLGTQFTLATGDASDGTFNITLRHEPTKPNDGSLSDAGGETDISVTFDLTVE